MKSQVQKHPYLFKKQISVLGSLFEKRRDDHLLEYFRILTIIPYRIIPIVMETTPHNWQTFSFTLQHIQITNPWHN